MPQYLPLPDGSSVTIRDGETPEQAWARAIESYPEAFGLEPTEITQPETGFVAGLKSGFQSLKGDIGAIGAGLGVEGAAEYAKAQREKAAQIAQTPELTEDPWGYVTTLLGQSAAYMAAPIAGAALVGSAPVSGALGLGALGAGMLGAGAVSAAQFTGSNLSRQLEEGTAPEDLQLGAAVAAAVPQAALDTVALKFIPGINKLVGKFGRELTKEESLNAARKLAEASAAGLIKAGGIKTAQVAGVEGLTEAGQQVFERMQAGLDLMDEQAREEYIDNFVGGATLGGLFGAGSRIGAQSRAKQELAAEDQRIADEKAAEQKRLADAEQARIEAEEKAKISPQDVFLESIGLKPDEAAQYASVEEAASAWLDTPAEPTPEAVDATASYIADRLEASPTLNMTGGAMQPPVEEVVDLLMDRPDMAAQIVKQQTKIPGLNRQENAAVRGALKLQIKELGAQIGAGREQVERTRQEEAAQAASEAAAALARAEKVEDETLRLAVMADRFAQTYPTVATDKDVAKRDIARERGLKLLGKLEEIKQRTSDARVEELVGRLGDLLTVDTGMQGRVVRGVGTVGEGGRTEIPAGMLPSDVQKTAIDSGFATGRQSQNTATRLYQSQQVALDDFGANMDRLTSLENVPKSKLRQYVTGVNKAYTKLLFREVDTRRQIAGMPLLTGKEKARAVESLNRLFGKIASTGVLDEQKLGDYAANLRTQLLGQAETATPTAPAEKAPQYKPTARGVSLVPRRKVVVPAPEDFVLGERGPRQVAETEELTDEEKLLQERVAVDQTTQKALFPEEQAKVVTERTTADKFQTFLDSQKVADARLKQKLAAPIKTQEDLDSRVDVLQEEKDAARKRLQQIYAATVGPRRPDEKTVTARAKQAATIARKRIAAIEKAIGDAHSDLRAAKAAQSVNEETRKNGLRDMEANVRKVIARANSMGAWNEFIRVVPDTAGFKASKRVEDLLKVIGLVDAKVNKQAINLRDAMNVLKDMGKTRMEDMIKSEKDGYAEAAQTVQKIQNELNKLHNQRIQKILEIDQIYAAAPKVKTTSADTTTTEELNKVYKAARDAADETLMERAAMEAATSRGRSKAALVRVASSAPGEFRTGVPSQTAQTKTSLYKGPRAGRVAPSRSKVLPKELAEAREIVEREFSDLAGVYSDVSTSVLDIVRVAYRDFIAAAKDLTDGPTQKQIDAVGGVEEAQLRLQRAYDIARKRLEQVKARAEEVAEAAGTVDKLIAEANIQQDERLRLEAKAAKEAVDEMQKKSAKQKRAEAKEAKAIADELAKSAASARKKPKDFDKLFDAADDADDISFLREQSDAYDVPSFTTVKVNVSKALQAGDAVKAAELLAENGSTPVVRKLAGVLSSLLGNTKVEMVSDLYVDGKRAAGNYIPRTGVLQFDEEAVSEETILHEMIHAATIRALKAPKDTLTDDQKMARAELESMFAAVKKNTKLAREYGMTDIAEFAAEMMSNRVLQDKLSTVKWSGGGNMFTRFINKVLAFLGFKESVDFNKKAADNILRLFERAMPLTEGKQIDNLASVLRGVFPNTASDFAAGVPANVRAAAEAGSAQAKTIGQKLDAALFNPSSGLAWRTQLLDRFAPIEALLKKGVARGMLPDMQLFQTLYYLRFGEQRSQYVAQAASNGPIQRIKQPDGTFTIESVKGANLAKIAETLRGAGVGNEQAVDKMFNVWLTGLRAGQKAIGWDKLNYENPAEAKARWEVINDHVQTNEKVKDAFESARKQYREYNAGLLDFLADSGAMSRAEAARLKSLDYVPFYRVNGEAIQLTIDTEKAPVIIGNIKDQPYLRELVGGKDPVDSFFSNSLQNTNLLMDMALRNLQTKDVAHVIQKMGYAQLRKGSGPAGTNIVRYREHGEMMHAVIDEDMDGIPADLLVKGMEGIKATIPAIVRLMQYPANLLRKTVTLMPSYALRQAVRDPLNAWLVTGGNFTPIASSFKELGKMVGGKSSLEDTLQQAGAISSNVFTNDRQDMERILRNIAGGKGGWHSLVAKAEGFAIQGDSATRAVLYNMYRQKGMTHMQALLGSLESMNFSRRGVSPSMQFMSMMVPFFNAQVQGLDVLWRAGTGASLFEKEMQVRQTMLRRGIFMAAGTMAYAALMQDDDTYKNATPEQRALNWFVPIPGADVSLRVPIPFELGYAFKSIPEMFFNVAFGDEKAKDAVKTFGALMYNTVPVGLPQGIKPIVEVAANYNFFTGEPIEYGRMMGLQKSERYSPNTTELAKYMSAVTRSLISPAQVEHLVRGYTSSLGITLMQIPDIALRPLSDQAERPTKLINEYPVIGTLFQPADGRGIVNAAYDRIEEFQQAKTTFNKLIEEGRQADAKAFAQKHATEIAANSIGGSFRQQMGELAKLKRGIAGSKELTPDQKRDKIQQIKKLEIELARRIRAIE